MTLKLHQKYQSIEIPLGIWLFLLMLATGVVLVIVTTALMAFKYWG